MGTLLTYALNSSNQLVHVDSVRHGGACLCHCPYCKSPLDAKNGGHIRRHHFAHAHGHSCEGAYESAVHLLAKQIIQEEGGVMLPESSDGNRPVGFVPLRNVEVEKMDEKLRIKPDVEGMMADGRRLLVECMVTHRVSYKKYRTIIENGLLCVEINLKWLDFDKDVLRDFLIHDSGNRKWITVREKKKPSGGSASFRYRNPVFDKAKKLLKEAFDNGNLSIRQHRRTDDYDYWWNNKDNIYNLRDLGYDICEVDTHFQGFKSDLLLFCSTQGKYKGYISINFRRRRRKRNSRLPRGLRIIDIILHNESDEILYSRFSTGLLSSHSNNVIFTGDWNF